MTAAEPSIAASQTVLIVAARCEYCDSPAGWEADSVLACNRHLARACRECPAYQDPDLAIRVIPLSPDAAAEEAR